jgi:signal transduction histidine kinase
MFGFFNTLKVKLFFSFFSFIFIIGGITVTGFWFYERRESLGKVIGNLEQITAENIQAFKKERDFFTNDIISIPFYQTGQSANLIRHRELMLRIEGNLRQLRHSSSIQDFSIESNLDSVLLHVQLYSQILNKIVVLTRLRGFKDSGLEGEMRQYAHTLEEGNYISKVHLLTLRRYEKDYMLRKDISYATMLEEVSKALFKELEQNPNSKKNRAAHKLLSNYLNTFRKILEIDQTIGYDFSKGLKRELDIRSEEVERELEDTLVKANEQIGKLRESLQINFIGMLGLAIVISLLLSYFLADQITRPISHLSKHINQIVEDGFTEEIQPLPIPSRDEVGILTRNFNLMTGQIQQHIQEINRKSKVLQKQNMQLQSINLKLIASENKLKSLNFVKDKFFSIISHDLKGPLHTLTGFLQILIKYTTTFTEVELKEFAESMDTSVKRLITMLENLLQWSRSQAGSIEYKPENILLNQAIQENIHLFQDTARSKEINLVMETEDNVMVRVDRNMLDFILRNLISNALKFTRQGGEVKVAVRSGETLTQVSVIDNGMGISPENIKKIFQPDVHFSTPGTGKEKGTGFGLLLCKDFVEKNGGTISIDSVLGKGTTLKFTIPSVHKDAPVTQQVNEG